MLNNLVFLVTNEQIIEFYKKWGHIFTRRSYLVDIYRDIATNLLYFVYSFCKGVTSFFDEIFTLDYFFEYSGINSFYEKLYILFFFVAIFSIFVTVIKNMSEMKVTEKSIFFSTFLSFILIFSLPPIMSETGKFVETVVKEYGNSSSAIDDIYKNSFVDLEYNFVKKDFDLEKIKIEKSNELEIDQVQYIQVNELLLNDSNDPKHEMLKYRIKNEKNEVYKMPVNRWFVPEMLYNGYYRWHVSYGYSIIFLLSMAFIYIKNSLTIASIYFDLAIYKVVGSFIIATDVEDDAKKKYILREILVGFFSILGIFLTMKIFDQLSLYINTLNINSIVKIFLIVGAILSVSKVNSFVAGAYGVSSSNKNGIFYTLFLLRQTKNFKNKLSGNNSRESINNSKNTEKNNTNKSTTQQNNSNSKYKDTLQNNKNNPQEKNSGNSKRYNDYLSTSDKSKKYDSNKDKKNYYSWEKQDKNNRNYRRNINKE